MNIDDASYLLLGTKKKDGSFVHTPVWFAQENDQYFVFSAADSGKVKRLRNFSDAWVAPCSASGKPLGDEIKASAQLVDASDSLTAAKALLLKKYGWQMRILDFFSKLIGNYNKRQFIIISRA